MTDEQHLREYNVTILIDQLGEEDLSSLIYRKISAALANTVDEAGRNEICGIRVERGGALYARGAGDTQ